MNYSIVNEYERHEVSSVKVFGFASVNVVVFLVVFFFVVVISLIF